MSEKETMTVKNDPDFGRALASAYYDALKREESAEKMLDWLMTNVILMVQMAQVGGLDKAQTAELLTAMVESALRD